MDRLYYRLPETVEELNLTENGILQLSAVGKLPAYILTGGFFVIPRYVAEIDHMPFGERMLFKSRVMRQLGIKNNMARIADCCIREFVTGDSEITAFIDNKAFSYTAQNGENKCGLLGFDLYRDNQEVKLKDCELVFKPTDIERLKQSMPQDPAQPQHLGEAIEIPEERESNIKAIEAFQQFENLKANQISWAHDNDSTAVILIGKKQFKVSAADFGTNPESVSWQLLERAAINNGHVKHEGKTTTVKGDISRLRNLLKSAMGLKSNPIQHTKGAGYKFALCTMTHRLSGGKYPVYEEPNDLHQDDESNDFWRDDDD